MTQAIFYYLLVRNKPHEMQNISVHSHATQMQLKRNITFLSHNIGERNLANFEKLETTFLYLKNECIDMGYKEGTHLDIIHYTATYRGEGFKNEYNNKKIIKDYPYKMKIIEATIYGQPDSNPKNETIVIGAHYDTADGSPGADDNSSGVAAILEIARHMINYQGNIKRNLKLVLFPNEEEPYSLDAKTIEKKSEKYKYGVHTMGSRYYARRAKERGENIKMIALESIGYFSNEKGSQKFPTLPYGLLFNFLKKPFLSLIQPMVSNDWYNWYEQKLDTITKKKLSLWPIFWLAGYSNIGNDIKFVYPSSASTFGNHCKQALKSTHPSFPIDAFSVPDWLPLAGRLTERSDHGAFLREGFEAIMITTTADMRNPHYHTSHDTVEAGSVQFETLTQVVEALKRMTVILVSNDTDTS